MSNPYDQFDNVPPALGAPQPKPGEEPNPYDRFVDTNDGTLYPQGGAYTAGVEAPRNYQAWEVLPEAMRNIPQSAANFFGGMWQTLTHPQETGEALARLLKGGVANLATPEAREAMVAQHPELQNSIDSANAVGQAYKDRYGGVQNIANTLATDPVGMAADATALVPNPLNPLRALNPVTRGTGAAVRGAANALAPEQNLLLRATEGQESQILNRLRDPAIELVPGSIPNAGQAVAAPGGATRWQNLVGQAEQRLGTAHGQADHTRNQARLADIDQVGRTHALTDEQIGRAGGAVDPATASIDELRQALREADATNYGPIDARMVTADDQLIDLLNRPSGDIVQAIAREIAAEEGRPFQVGANAPAQSTPSTVLGPDGRPLTVDTPAEYAQYRGEDLIRIKKAFDRLASSRELRAKYAIDDDAARQIAATRSEFVNWMEADGRLPEHRTAVEDSRAWRTLIDRRNAGEVFGHTLSGSMGPDQLAQRASAFANLFDSPRNAVTGNSNVGKATRFDYDNWAELLTPEDMEILTRNLDDLSRDKLAADQSRLANWHSGEIDNASPGAQAPSLLNPKITVLNALLNTVTGRANNRVSERVANALLTPDGGAEILERAIAHRDRLNQSTGAWRNLDESIQLLHRQGGAGYNALNAEREGREKRKRNNL